MLGINGVNGDEEMIEMVTEGDNATIVDRMKKGREDKGKSGMTQVFSGWGDKNVLYGNRGQRQWV